MTRLRERREERTPASMIAAFSSLTTTGAHFHHIVFEDGKSRQQPCSTWSTHVTLKSLGLSGVDDLLVQFAAKLTLNAISTGVPMLQFS